MMVHMYNKILCCTADQGVFDRNRYTLPQLDWRTPDWTVRFSHPGLPISSLFSPACLPPPPCIKMDVSPRTFSRDLESSSSSDSLSFPSRLSTPWNPDLVVSDMGLSAQTSAPQYLLPSDSNISSHSQPVLGLCVLLILPEI